MKISSTVTELFTEGRTVGRSIFSKRAYKSWTPQSPFPILVYPEASPGCCRYTYIWVYWSTSGLRYLIRFAQEPLVCVVCCPMYGVHDPKVRNSYASKRIRTQISSKVVWSTRYLIHLAMHFSNQLKTSPWYLLYDVLEQVKTGRFCYWIFNFLSPVTW